MLNAMAGCFEFLRATKRIHRTDGFDERVLVVKRDLNLKPLDAARILLQFPYFHGLELIARHRRPAREIGRQQILRTRDELVAVPETNRVTEPGMRSVHVLVFLTDVDTSYSWPVIIDEVG